MRIRRMVRSFTGLVAVAATLGVAACATAGTGTATTEGSGNTTLRVQNNLVPGTTLNVYSVTDAGARTLIGTVTPGATASLRFDTQVGDRLRFVAEPADGKAIMTPSSIAVSPGRTIRWDVNANVVR